MRISLTEVAGQTLRVGIRAGDKARTPLLLFNGIGGNIELVEPFLQRLDGLEAIVFDVLGVSWGGALAQQFAFQQGTRCRRLVLAATSPGHLMVPGKLTVLLKMATPRRYKEPDYMRRIVGNIYGGAFRTSPELVREHLRHVRWSSDYGYYLQLIAALGWSSLPWLPFLGQPTLVMMGTDDPIVPLVNGRILAKLIPNARLVTIDDGHLFLLTSAKEAATHVTEFLR